MDNAIVLLSGGLDSATSLFWAKKNGFRPFCLIFDYGQRHKKEIDNARAIAKKAKCGYEIVKFNLASDTTSLVNKKLKLPKKVMPDEIPSTYAPARNIIFLSLGVSFAETKKAQFIVIGTNQLDYSNYPDCRDEFIRAFQKAINLGTKSGTQAKTIKILTPLQNKNKAQIIKLAVKLKVPLELTWSCYAGNTKPCNICPSCIIRAKGFKEAGVADPILR